MAKDKTSIGNLPLKNFLGHMEHFIELSIPVDVIGDIVDWDIIFKSKSSLSFYNKQKSWIKTIDGTIRISDHWNFIAERATMAKNIITDWRADYVHCRTDIGINKQWAMGKYDSSTKIYNILKVYTISDDNIEKLLELKKQLVTKINLAKAPFPVELIEKRKHLKKLIKGNLVKYVSKDISGYITDIKGKEGCSLHIDDSKYIISASESEFSKIIIDGIELDIKDFYNQFYN